MSKKAFLQLTSCEVHVSLKLINIAGFVCCFRFGLFEAMSAIEMMDPKMDAGMLCNKAKKVLQFEPAVKVSSTVRIGPNIVQSEHTVLYTTVSGHYEISLIMC